MMVIPAVCFGEEQQYGFKDIPFGTPQKKVVSSLKNEFGKKFSVKKGDVSVRDFELGNMKAAVHFLFDHKKRFYKFDFRISANTIGDLVSRTSDFIYIFKKKYGETESCTADVNVNNVCNPPINVPCTWDHKDLFVEIQNQCGESGFITTGRVSLRKLAEEEAEYIKGKHKRKLDDAVKKF